MQAPVASGQELSAAERTGRLGQRQSKTRLAWSRRVRRRRLQEVGARSTAVSAAGRAHLRAVGKLLSELAAHRLRVELDGLRVGADERAAVDSGGPLRDIATLEALEERGLDLGGGRNRRDGNVLAFAFVTKPRAEAVCHERSSPWCCLNDRRVLELVHGRGPAPTEPRDPRDERPPGPDPKRSRAVALGISTPRV